MIVAIEFEVIVDNPKQAILEIAALGGSEQAKAAMELYKSGTPAVQAVLNSVVAIPDDGRQTLYNTVGGLRYRGGRFSCSEKTSCTIAVVVLSSSYEDCMDSIAWRQQSLPWLKEA